MTTRHGDDDHDGPAPNSSTTAQQILERLKQKKENVVALKAVYEDLFGVKMTPYDRQFNTWLSMYDDDLGLIVEAFYKTNEWFNLKSDRLEKLKAEGKGVPKEFYKGKDDIVSYASGVMSTEKKLRNGIIPEHMKKRMEEAGEVVKSFDPNVQEDEPTFFFDTTDANE